MVTLWKLEVQLVKMPGPSKTFIQSPNRVLKLAAITAWLVERWLVQMRRKQEFRMKLIWDSRPAPLCNLAHEIQPCGNTRQQQMAKRLACWALPGFAEIAC